jgi:hypothetical protein
MQSIVLVSTLFLALALPQDSSTDIDDFMEKVLERRDINWDDFYNYTCREQEVLEVESSLEAVPMHGFLREHIWFVRDGYLVRSPMSINGVKLSREERDNAERKWIERVKKREEKEGVDRDRFFGFKFEPGNYYFAGRKEYEGREVVAVEYYPETFFSDEDEEDPEDAEIEEKLNKVFLITMLIDPEEHQIVQMTIDNVGFDFLPGGWLVRIGTIEASMTMHQPFGDIWLPRDIKAYGKVTTAAGDLAVRYTMDFHDYAIAETRARYRFPPRGVEKKQP